MKGSCDRHWSARQVVHDSLCVAAGAADEAGVPAVLEPLADHVHPGRPGQPAGLAERVVRTLDRKVDPVVVRPPAEVTDRVPLDHSRRNRGTESFRAEERQPLFRELFHEARVGRRPVCLHVVEKLLDQNLERNGFDMEFPEQFLLMAILKELGVAETV